MNKLLVIIPFFQRNSGVLNRTLLSIDTQTAFESIKEVVIVDDGSPIKTETEFDGLSEQLGSKITVIKQKNSGVSKARNVGLDYASKKADYVAFLDSDDIWLENHIERMQLAFDLGADFYFSNFYQPDQTVGAFERAGKLDLDKQTRMEGCLYSYNEDMTSQILTGNLIGTPTVGFNYLKYKHLRFKESLQFAGEDYLFWLDLVRNDPVIIFSTKCHVRCEHGVNIFASAKWGTIHLQKRIRDELFFRKQVLKNYQLNSEVEQSVTKKVWDSRKQFLLNSLALFKRGNFQALPILAKTICKDPKILLSIL